MIRVARMFSIYEEVMNKWSVPAGTRVEIVKPIFEDIFLMHMELERIFGNPEAVKLFMSKPNAALEGKTPIECLPDFWLRQKLRTHISVLLRGF